MFLLSLSLDRINIISSLYLDSWSNESSQRSLAEKPAYFAGYWLLYTTLEKCHCKLQGPIKSRNFGSKLTHLCGFWLDISFFSHVKTHRSQFSLDIIIFFTFENYCLLLWLARTHLHMIIYDIAFGQVFLSMYMYMLQVKIISWLKSFFNLGWFSISFVFLAIIIRELG